MNLTKEQVARMIDISAVKAESTIAEVNAIVRAAIQHRFISVFTLPSLAPYAKNCLANESEVFLGGVVGFPSGGSTTTAKAFEAEELIEIGCQELDMVINIGQLKSQQYSEVAADIQKIVQLTVPIPVKVILEVNLLEDAEICAGAQIILDSGAQFIKTGTGWAGATSLEHIQLIKQAVGENILLKVAGGVRNLDLLLQMHAMGVSRFGIGNRSAIAIMDEFQRSSEG
jgi:deoxyribose-phosphate aldolase